MESSGYSVQNGVKFQWSSVTGDLNPDRVDHLQRFLCGDEILDAGCGGGAYVEFLIRQGFKVTGVDYHEMFLEIARKRQNALGTYVQGDITSLPFPDKSFDCSYCFDVFEHVDDAKALTELIRVSRSRVIICVPGTDHDAIGCGMTFRHYQDLTHLRTYTSESLEKLFHTVEQRQFQILPELAVDFRGAATVHLEANSKNPFSKAFLRRLYHPLIRRLLVYARYRVIHSGWLAVIDLKQPASV